MSKKQPKHAKKKSSREMGYYEPDLAVATLVFIVVIAFIMFGLFFVITL